MVIIYIYILIIIIILISVVPARRCHLGPREPGQQRQQLRRICLAAQGKALLQAQQAKEILGKSLRNQWEIYRKSVENIGKSGKTMNTYGNISDFLPIKCHKLIKIWQINWGKKLCPTPLVAGTRCSCSPVCLAGTVSYLIQWIVFQSSQ